MTNNQEVKQMKKNSDVTRFYGKNKQDKLFALLNLMRINSPTGYLLSFFPAAFGTLLAHEKFSDFLYLPLFMIGSILSRGAGCVINDLLDQEFDKKVARTKKRPIANGDVSIFEALLLLAILMFGCLVILFFLTVTSILLCFITLLLITLYPLMKRITYFPQAFLGITFNMGCLIGYSAIKDNISYEVAMVYISCGFWTFAYDTIYAFMDIEDDKKIGVKSSAIFFENFYYRQVVGLFYILFLSLLFFSLRDASSIYTLIGIFISFSIAAWIVLSFDIKNPKNCLVRFKANNYIGFTLFFAMILEKL